MGGLSALLENALLKGKRIAAKGIELKKKTAHKYTKATYLPQQSELNKRRESQLEFEITSDEEAEEALEDIAVKCNRGVENLGDISPSGLLLVRDRLSEVIKYLQRIGGKPITKGEKKMGKVEAILRKKRTAATTFGSPPNIERKDTVGSVIDPGFYCEDIFRQCRQLKGSVSPQEVFDGIVSNDSDLSKEQIDEIKRIALDVYKVELK